MKIEIGDEYRVENVPVKTRAGRPRLHPEYPLAKLKVGQSFLVEGGDVITLNRLRGAAYYYGVKHGVKFSVMKEGSGYRCGRIK